MEGLRDFMDPSEVSASSKKLMDDFYMLFDRIKLATQPRCRAAAAFYICLIVFFPDIKSLDSLVEKVKQLEWHSVSRHNMDNCITPLLTNGLIAQVLSTVDIDRDLFDGVKCYLPANPKVVWYDYENELRKILRNEFGERLTDLERLSKIYENNFGKSGFKLIFNQDKPAFEEITGIGTI